jgi:hypothetical protein
MKVAKRFKVKFFEGLFSPSTEEAVNNWLDSHREIDIVTPIWFDMTSDVTFKAIMIYREDIPKAARLREAEK